MYLIGQEEIDAVTAVLQSAQLFRYRPFGTSGHLHETEQFEAEFAAAVGVSHCLAVTSGTAALSTTLAALGVGPGDEVLVPGFTFIAAAYAPLAVGAIPVIVEIDDSLTIDSVDLERKITERTKAIFPTYMYGLPCNMDPILELARRHNLLVIEDACQCAGGTYKGRNVGSLGHAGCFSFNHFKTITCGEGGALVTDDPSLLERARIYHDPGISHRFRVRSDEPVFAGVNYRFNEILAAIARVQLRRLAPWVERLKAIRSKWHERLEGHGRVRPAPLHDPNGGSATHLILIAESPADAKELARATANKGLMSFRPIDTGRHVYDKWEAVMTQVGSHDPRHNPFDHPSVKGRWHYAPDMCPRTLAWTSTSVAIGLSPLWDEATEAEKLDQLVEAASSR